MSDIDFYPVFWFFYARNSRSYGVSIIAIAKMGRMSSCIKAPAALGFKGKRTINFAMMLFRIILFFLFINTCLKAQDIPRDTSFTLYSTYMKLRNDHPFIEMVKPEMPAGVLNKKDVVYRTLDSRQLKIDVFYPAKDNNQGYPGVLLIHGGGWRTGDKSLQWPMAQQLAANGYVAATVEYRLSLEASYPAAIHDLKTAIRWIRAHAGDFNLDTSRIAAYGTSAGGQLAALVGTTNGLDKFEGEGDYKAYSSKVQAIIDVDGILAFKHPESEEGTMAGQWLGGTYEEAPENWNEASALTHVGGNTPPVLFIASSYPRFHAGKGDMIQVLEQHGIYYESHYIPDAPHAFWLLDPWFEPILDYTLGFLNKIFRKKD